jgi:fructose-1,6-bisphosphatase/inositol monophosphatase family enzyme
MTTIDLFSPRYRQVASVVESAVMGAAEYLIAEARAGNELHVTVKADNTIVMNLDIESQQRILEALPTGVPIVAEEDESSHNLIHNGGTYFLVDPLDGTTSCKRFFGQQGGHVGYGPLVGYVEDDQLKVASFFSVPHASLFTAVRGEGCYLRQLKPGIDVTQTPATKLAVPACALLRQAGVLFFLGKLGEGKIIQRFKDKDLVENIYRFGGFANDCSRLAQGFEQVGIQFSVKPWDFTAVLFAVEAGLEAWLDPLGRRIPFSEWRMEDNNPIIMVHPHLRDELFKALDEIQ